MGGCLRKSVGFGLDTKKNHFVEADATAVHTNSKNDTKNPENPTTLHDGAVLEVVAVDGSTFVTSGADGSVTIIEPCINNPKNHYTLKQRKNHRKAITRVAIWNSDTHSHTLMALGGRDKSIQWSKIDSHNDSHQHSDSEQDSRSDRDNNNSQSMHKHRHKHNRSGRIQRINKEQAHTLTISGLDFSTNGEKIVSGSRDATIKVWDVQTGKITLQWQKIEQNVVTQLRCIPNEECVLQSSEDLTLRVWDQRCGGKPVQTFEDGPCFTINCDVTGDGQKFLTVHNGSGGQEGRPRNGCQVRIWDRKAGRLWKELNGHTEAVNGGRFVDGRHTFVVSGSKDQHIKLWDVEKSEEIGQMYCEHSRGLQALALVPRNDTRQSAVVAGTVSGHLVCYQFDLTTGEFKGL